MKKDNLKNLQEHELKLIEDTRKAILDGKIYTQIVSVAKSGMSRRIRFFMVNENKAIIDVTAPIGWLTGWIDASKEDDKYKSRGKYAREAGLYVGGCGMDMIFHTLYVAIGGHKTEWNQRYNTL